MSRFLLVPENFDFDEAKEIKLPENLYPDSTADTAQKETKKITKNVDGNISAENNIKGKYLSHAVIKFAIDRVKARQLLRFLKENHFKHDKNGRLVLKNKVYPIILETSFLDLINDTRKSKRNELFYTILRDNGVPLNILPKSKQKYFK